jgi:ParB-like nuclease domain./KorB domain.
MGIKDLSLGRGGDIFRIPLKKLRIPPADLSRLEFDNSQYKISELARSIAEKGQQEPMTVRIAKVGGEEVAYITNGCRRFMAMIYANEKLDASIDEAKCINEPAGTTEETRVLLQFQKNDGKPFTQLECGIGFQRLQKAGWSLAKMAAESHKSKTWVADCLALAADPEAIKAAVGAGKIKPATAKKLRTADEQDKQTALLKADMGQKVTGKDVDEAKAERKAHEKPAEAPRVDAGIIADGLRARGFENAVDVPHKKGNITIRIEQIDPPFIAVLVQ